MFLSISGLLVFALLGTLVETARYTACANHMVRTVRTSAEGLFTEYSRPLYDHYGLFFLEGGEPSYEKVIAGYVADTMEASARGNMDFLQGEIRQIRVTDKTYPGDEGGRALQQEISQYMGRRLTKKQMDQWLNDSSKMAESQDKAEDIEKTVEEQKEMAELDGRLLKLMRWVDGISVSNGRISCEREFIKMFSNRELRGQNFGVQSKAVWEKMKKNIDRTPKNWAGMERAKFLKRVERVCGLADQAVQEAEKLKAGYDRLGMRNREFADHDKKMELLVRQMAVLETNRDILSETKKILSRPGEEGEAERLGNLWDDYDTDSICFDYTGVEEKGGAQNPLEMLSGAWADGILNLVCQDQEKLSKAKVSGADNFAGLYGEEEEGEACGERITSLTDEEKVSLSGILGDMAGYGMNEFCLDSYILDRFSGYTEKRSDWKQSLRYQWEYVVAGKESDRENLAEVLTRILLVRVPVNFAALFRDPAKKATAYAAAAAIVGFTGLEPLIRLTQTLILLAWSVAEGLVDVAGFLQGRNVPLIKTPSQILTTFPELFALSGRMITKRAEKFAKADKKSVGYKEYLFLFLAAMGQSTRLYRIMDLVQWDMVKNGYTEFRLGECAFSIKITASARFPARFFRFPVIGGMLGRDIRSYSYSCEIVHGYL